MLMMAHAAANAHASSKPIRAIGEGLTISSAQQPMMQRNVSTTGSSERYNMHVLFLSADSPQDHILNRITSALGARVHHNRGFCHTEICVPDLENTHAYLSSSIYNGETVTLTKTKTFANPGYTVLTFTVTRAELVSITNYLHEAKRMQLKFDAVGMYLAALPFQLNFFSGSKVCILTQGAALLPLCMFTYCWTMFLEQATFCSKHVTHALRCAGIEAVAELNENIVTPSKLYKVRTVVSHKDTKMHCLICKVFSCLNMSL